MTQGLRKVESSMLKEHGEEKARRALYPKCRSERTKVGSTTFVVKNMYFQLVFVTKF
jgi:hypothetical protein